MTRGMWVTGCFLVTQYTALEDDKYVPRFVA